MTNSAQHQSWSRNLAFRSNTAALTILVLLAFSFVVMQSAEGADAHRAARVHRGPE